jgi:hypothetical protein
VDYDKLMAKARDAIWLPRNISMTDHLYNGLSVIQDGIRNKNWNLVAQGQDLLERLADRMGRESLNKGERI